MQQTLIDGVLLSLVGVRDRDPAVVVGERGADVDGQRRRGRIPLTNTTPDLPVLLARDRGVAADRRGHRPAAGAPRRHASAWMTCCAGEGPRSGSAVPLAGGDDRAGRGVDDPGDRRRAVRRARSPISTTTICSDHSHPVLFTRLGAQSARAHDDLAAAVLSNPPGAAGRDARGRCRRLFRHVSGISRLLRRDPRRTP